MIDDIVIGDDIFIGDYNSFCYENEGMFINDMDQCLNAALKIKDQKPNALFRGEEDSTRWPKGCNLLFVSNPFRVFFNKHSVGNRHPWARPICNKNKGIS